MLRRELSQAEAHQLTLATSERAEPGLTLLRGPEANSPFHEEVRRDVMGLVAQATQQIETERIQKLEADQKAKLSAQNAEQHVSFMQTAIMLKLTESKGKQKLLKLRQASMCKP